MSEEKQIANEPIIKPLRLTFQGSITIETAEDADIVYDELKIFIKNYGRDCTLNGQIIKPLEPCCSERKDKKNVDQNSKIHE